MTSVHDIDPISRLQARTGLTVDGVVDHGPCSSQSRGGVTEIRNACGHERRGRLSAIHLALPHSTHALLLNHPSILGFSNTQLFWKIQCFIRRCITRRGDPLHSLSAFSATRSSTSVLRTVYDFVTEVRRDLVVQGYLSDLGVKSPRATLVISSIHRA